MKKDKIQQIVRLLKELYTSPKPELWYETPFQLLVATVLAAQCTDKRVNETTPDFFKRFPTPEVLAVQTPLEVGQVIKSISFFNTKAKHLVGLAKVLVEKFKGEVPTSPSDFEGMPGVGRKTANAVCAGAFGAKVIAVDTHVQRVTLRLGILREKKYQTPKKLEVELMEILPSEALPEIGFALTLHGRYVCRAKSPDCEGCRLNELCDYFLANLGRRW